MRPWQSNQGPRPGLGQSPPNQPPAPGLQGPLLTHTPDPSQGLSLENVSLASTRRPTDSDGHRPTSSGPGLRPPMLSKPPSQAQSTEPSQTKLPYLSQPSSAGGVAPPHIDSLQAHQLANGHMAAPVPTSNGGPRPPMGSRPYSQQQISQPPVGMRPPFLQPPSHTSFGGAPSISQPGPELHSQHQQHRPVTPSSPRPHTISISGAPPTPPPVSSSDGHAGFTGAPGFATGATGSYQQPPSAVRPPAAFGYAGPTTLSASPNGLVPPMGSSLPSPGLMGPPGVAPIPRPPVFGAASVAAAQPLPAQQSASVPQPRPSRSMKVDERQVPRPLSQGAEELVFETRREGKMNAPPSAATAFVVRDNGNCTPRAIRSTLNSMPMSSDLLRTAAMPLALIVQPLAQAMPGDDVPQVVDFGETGPLRCSSCGAYINPYMQFLDAGRVFKCNFCNATNQTPPAYVENTGPDGRRRDADQRPELSKGSVEFVANLPIFMVRPPMPPTHLFLIDVSHNAVSSGAVAATCAAIADTLDVLPGGDRAHIGIATFDSTIHFYPIRKEQEHTQMLVVPDVNAVYCPLPQGLLVPIEQGRPMVDQMLEQIPTMFAETQIIDSCSGAAIDAAILALQAATGGKLHVFLTSLPKVGAHALPVRDGGMGAEGKDTKIMQPATKDYPALATQAAEAQISIDVFVLSTTFCDVPSLSSLTQPTAGQLYHYYPYSAAIHDDQLANDLRWNIMRPQGWEAICRLRCSEGLEVDKYLGGFYQRSTTDIEFPALSSEHALAIRLRHTGRLKEDREAYLQFAMLYSTSEGARRIRVHTLALPVSNVMGAIFRGADLDAFLNYTTHSTVAQAPGKPPKVLQDAVTKACVDMLLSYRKNCAVTSRAGQLILPEPLQLLPLYSLAFVKSPALRASIRPDIRAAWLARLATAPCSRIVALLWPRLLPLHPLVEEPTPVGRPVELPQPVGSLSARVLDQKGIYLLENGTSAVVHFGPDAPSHHIMQLLGMPSVPKMEGPGSHLPLPLPQLDTPASRAVHDVIAQIQRERGTWLALSVARLHSPDLADFHAALVEDRSGAGQSYMEYLCAVHQQIQNVIA